MVETESQPKPRFKFPLWRLGEKPKEKKERIERLQQLVTEGQKLSAMHSCSSCGGWPIIEQEKEYWLNRYNEQLHNPALDDRKRSDLVHEWAGVQGFFKAVSYRIERGKQAELELKSEK